MENKQYTYNIINRGFSDCDYDKYIESNPETFVRYLNGEKGQDLIDEGKRAEMANMVHNNMNGILNFIFEDNSMRIIVKGNTPDCTLFCGPDVASVLEYTDPHNMYQMLLPNEKIDIYIPNLIRGNSTGQDLQHGGLRHMMFITLPGLFRVISRSRHAKAMDFQNWVYHIVLPSIWNYGYYASANTRANINNNPNLALEYNKKIDELERQIDVMAPKASFGNFVLDNIQPINIEELAKLLNTSGIDIGRNRLFELLRKDGYLMKNSNVNKPTQKALDSGLLMYNIIPLYNGNVCTYVYVTPKGIEYFINKYKDLNKK